MKADIRHDNRLNVIWIESNNIDYAKETAIDFLKQFETDDIVYNIDLAIPWKKDSSKIKIKYSKHFKKGGETNLRMIKESKQRYVVLTFDNLSKEEISEEISLNDINKGGFILGLNYNEYWDIKNLKLNEIFNKEYISDLDGEITNLTYKIKRIF